MLSACVCVKLSNMTKYIGHINQEDLHDRFIHHVSCVADVVTFTFCDVE